ncbi:MAG: hypothetical protein WAK26_14150 [Terracidiphilus sp.]
MEEGIKGENLPEQSSETTEVDAGGDVSGLMPAPEHGHGHEHKIGIPWLDAVIAASVVFISLISLVVSIEHGRSMERMVDQNQKLVVASTLPLLSVTWWDLDPVTYKPLERLNLRNDGVGPAIVERFEIRYKGVAQTTDTLIEACCAQAKDKARYLSFIGNISGTVLPARDTRNVLTIKPRSSDDKLFRGFDKVKEDISFRACYCSVLDECWETSFDQKRPQPVKACKVSPADKLW